MSKENDALVRFIEAQGIPARVTATTGRYISSANPCSPHTATSLHCAEATGGKGRAVDWGGVTPGTGAVAVAQMEAIWRAYATVAPHLAELFFNAPGITRVIKNGVWRDGLATLGPTTWAAHRTHVHVAVPRGVFLEPPTTKPAQAQAVPGSGPPTVIATQYPQGEDMLTRHDVDIPALDGQGRGWVELDVDPDKVVSMIVNGPYPAVDGYWELPVVARQNRGGKTIVTLTEGSPNERILLSVWTVG